ncbi:SH3 domain-containing protein [Bradyrhizobium ontarionense]|uniref:SH3 domain-containing protein n=1 Tax=Bradyrhizobium ontarionense TaxID=2898149 RepID=A0ABY3REK2_9BRAD|nr:SH3 domain-containing protein [Bradyrhizobium sp. A19]UFZ05385.1 SH3 domain-containing protein [Bradyrhizobium sp. A19]
MVKFKTCLFAALLMAMPVSLAAAAPGLVRTAATMRAGPGSGFPVVERIPAGARVTIHGCIEGGAWCDVSFDRERGWVAARALAYLDGQRYVYLPEYVEYVPVAPFVLTTYWSSFYIGRPWYYRHAFWNHYWRRHPPAMAQNPPQPGMTPRGPGPGGVAQPAGASGAVAGAGSQPPPPRMATGSPAPVTGAAGPRVSAGAASQTTTPVHVMQPPIGRSSGPPQSARAQMGGMRTMIGNAPQVGAAPRVVGSPAMGPSHISAGGPRGGGRSGSAGGFRRH